jgi:hypothetical protein
MLGKSRRFAMSARETLLTVSARTFKPLSTRILVVAPRYDGESSVDAVLSRVGRQHGQVAPEAAHEDENI